MTATTLPIDFDQAPDFSRGTWLAFTPDHSPDEARATFQARYGRQPLHVALDTRYPARLLKAGPVPEEETL